MQYTITISKYNNKANELIESQNVRKSNSYDNILDFFVKLIDKEKNIGINERKEISIVNKENNIIYLKNIIYGEKEKKDEIRLHRKKK